MFSYLSRGYGTWEGIAKLEKPDSAISPVANCGSFDVLPPINKDSYSFYDQRFDHEKLYNIPCDKLKLPEVPKNSLHIPKTYSTKRGALLLYSERSFVPGSRRLKKRPRFKRQKEKKIETMKDLIEVIMDYKKNGRDPLILEQLWRRMSGSARDVQPGYSPKRYLSHLSHTTFDPDSWKKLVETGSLKSFGTDDTFLPYLLPDEYGNPLNHRPPPYKTMSLPPISPSNSMVGSFTFYKHALSTGAASMVSLPSVNSGTMDDQVSAKTAGTFVESLAERLVEVESEAGFKKDYETLTAKEKEDLLTQLLMDVTLHNQGDVITVPAQAMTDSSTVNTDTSYLSDTKDSQSHKAIETYHSMRTLPSKKAMSASTNNKGTRSSTSGKSLRSDRTLKSGGSTKSLKSQASRTTTVCSLPPIVSKDNMLVADLENESKKNSLSSSRSGLSVVINDPEVGLNGIDIEIDNDSVYLDDSDIALERKESSTRSFGREKTSSAQSLIDALHIEEGEVIHQFTDESKSLKSLGSSHGIVCRSKRTDENLTDGVIGDESEAGNGDLANGVVLGDDTVGDNDGIAGGDVYGEGGHDGIDDQTYSDDNGGNGPNITFTVDTNDPYTDSRADNQCESINETVGLVPATEPQAPHMSLSNLQDEVRLVATEVLSRPKSGRTLVEDAEMATFLLIERMQGLLDPTLAVENVRARSAAPKKVRPLGQPRNSEKIEKRRARSAEATIASRIPKKSEENPAEQVSEPDEKPVDQVFKPEEKPVDQVCKSEDKQVDQVSKPEDKQVDQAFSEVQKPLNEDSVSGGTEENDVSIDDVIVTVDIVVDAKLAKPNETQSLEETSAIPSEGDELLTVKDLQPDKKEEDMKEDVPTTKETKGNVHKGAKVKKTGNTKRTTNKGRKKKSVVRAAKEPQKTPPFHAGLVPESKPPKGLARKTGAVKKKGNGKQASPDSQVKTEPNAKGDGKKSDVASSGIPVRVDSETGEVEHQVSPARSEKTMSRTGSKTPPDKKMSVSGEDEVSLGSKTVSPRAESNVSRTEGDVPCEKTPSPHHKTPPSPEQKACPRDRGAVFRENANASKENVNAKVVTETAELPAREPSPEVVLTEKQRRANARAAQRAAAAERRRQEVERKRREREEARRRAQEEEARLDVLRQEAEEEMKKREEERRIQKEQEERERMRLETEQKEHARQERLMIERQRQAREEWKRKKEQLMAQRKFEEELRLERERVEAQIEEERQKEYEEKIAHLEEEERERLLEERRLEEERIKREIQEEKEHREAERLQMLEERRKMEEELAAARERQLARQTFLQTLLQDFQNLLLDQRITRAFTFSYFDILPWFKDRWRDLQEDRPLSKRNSTPLETVPEESENEIENVA